MKSDGTELTTTASKRRRLVARAYMALLIGLAVLGIIVAFFGQRTVLAAGPGWLSTPVRATVGDGLLVAMLVGIWQFVALGLVGYGLVTFWTWVRIRGSGVRHVADVQPGAAVELEAEAHPVTTTLTAPLTGTECLAHGYEVEAHRPDQDRSSDWHTVGVGVESTPFRLEDATGVVTVDPAGATFHVSPSTATEFVERGSDDIPQGVEEVATLADVDLSEGASGLPPALSEDRYRFSERFRIEPGETVYVSGVATAEGAGLVIDAPRGAAARAKGLLTAPFIVSDASEARLERSLLRSAVGLTALGVLLFVAGVWAFITLV